MPTPDTGSGKVENFLAQGKVRIVPGEKLETRKPKVGKKVGGKFQIFA